MSQKSLQSSIEGAGDTLAYLRGTKTHRRDNPDWSPGLIIPQVPHQFTDWEREQRAWREGVALFDQSHHMQSIIVRGPQAKEFLSSLACNNLAKANPSRAFQMICASPSGHMIGDGILLQTAESEFNAVGPFLVNWIAYNAGVLDFDVSVEVDRRSRVYANGFASTRPECRYQIQGPNAWALIEKLNGGPVEDVPFFNVTEISIAGETMKGLRHGMAGTPGLEVWGPWEKREKILDAILKEGEEFGILQVGSSAYLTSAIESGWHKGAIPAVYTGDEMRAYREWIPADSLEGLLRLNGSQKADSVEDYYRTVFDIGYGRLIHFDHEFVGRDALLEMHEANRWQKVTLAWNPDDTANLLKEMLNPDGRDVKFLQLPSLGDKIDMQYYTLTQGDKEIGTAYDSAYLATERAMLTLALVDKDVQIGDEVTLHWGELGGGYGRHNTPATDIVPIRTIVSPAPYSRVAREDYRKN
jgi:vanillate/3-O-methylgallate O-demethylase